MVTSSSAAVGCTGRVEISLRGFQFDRDAQRLHQSIA
jgi:hypothetical protein